MPGVSQRRATRKWGKLAGSEGSRSKSGHTSFSPSAWTRRNLRAQVRLAGFSLANGLGARFLGAWAESHPPW